jgi:TonB family protein
MAVELDCDRRVLGHGKELRRYARLLVEMGRRRSMSRLSALALAHPTSFLERRIRTMTTRKRPRHTLTLAATLVASLFAMSAYQVEAPATLAELLSYVDATNAESTLIAAPQAPSVITGVSKPMQASSPVGDAAVAPQAVGRITGRAMDRQTSAPIQFVQIHIPTLRLGTLSRAPGNFVIENVPAGTYEIRAERVGLTTAPQTITVTDGGTVEVSFPMDSQALGMAELISNSPYRADSGSAGSKSQAASVPAVQRAGIDPDTPSFTPHSVRPQLSNAPEVQAGMVSRYPPMLKDAGVQGTVMMWLFIDAGGRVENFKMQQSSGQAALDQAALEVAALMRFSPALNRDQAVPVWVAIPLTFRP